jgi:hypothetical protein
MRGRRIGVISAFVGFFVTCAQSQAVVTTISPIVEDPVTMHQFQLLSNADWTDSEAKARSLGGHLMTITGQEDQNFVFSVFGGYGGAQRILWTGLYDPSQDHNGGAHAANFVWASGAPITYANWDQSQPDDAGGVEFYVAMYYPNYHNPGSWNDWSNRTSDPIGIPFYGVVEYVPEPAAISLGCLGGVLLLRPRHSTSRLST